jgi:hypothetical protein
MARRREEKRKQDNEKAAADQADTSTQRPAGDTRVDTEAANNDARNATPTPAAANSGKEGLVKNDGESDADFEARKKAAEVAQG